MSFLKYWIEDADFVWVKVPKIPEDEIIKLRVEKSGSETPNGDDTFIFFDDFEDGTIDTDKWTTSGNSWSIVDGALRSTTKLHRIFCEHEHRNSVAFRYKHRWAHEQAIPLYLLLGTGTAFNSENILRMRAPVTRDSFYSYDVNIDGTWDYTSIVVDEDTDTWMKAEARILSDYTGYHYINDDFDPTFRTGHPTVDFEHPLEFPNTPTWEDDRITIINDHWGSGNHAQDTDWIFIRKFADDDPVISVEDKGSYYEIEIDNSGGDELTDYQIKIDAAGLDGVTNNESLEISVHEDLGSIKGTVWLNGNTVENARLTLIDSEDNIEIAFSLSDGTYSFTDLDDTLLYHITVEYVDGDNKYHSYNYHSITPKSE